MRITAGKFKGRTLVVPALAGLRPTPAKVRQALFNIIPPLFPSTLDDSRMLDLFSGSGIMAVEALSRGVSHVVSCEQSAKARHSMQNMAKKLALDSSVWQWLAAPLPNGLEQFSDQHFTWVFADPPYRQGIAEKIPGWLQDYRISCDLLVIEEASDVCITWKKSHLKLSMIRRYGSTSLHFLR
ncbi:MAG: RsmD family RNA methyltransferase [Mariprofundaceae bacterium]|nr:RsmD family RNA methyltransferase [Mariprofundaceae bacterium]